MSKEDRLGLNLTGITLQRFLIEAVRDEDATYTYDPGGKSLSFSHDGYSLTFNGFGLAGVDVSFTGVTTDFVIEGKGGSITGLFIVAPEYDDLYNAAEAGSGAVNPENFSSFYDLYVPAGHFYIANGDNRDNTAEGSNGDDFASLGKGNDTWIAGLGNDNVDGGKGTDTADLSEIGVTVDFNLASGSLKFGAYESAYAAFEDARGTAFGDTFTGGNGANWLFGEGGNDIVKGQRGDDWVNGGAGRDRLFDGLGSDWFVGGKGADRFVLFGPEAGNNVIADLEPGKDLISFRAFGFTMPEDVLGRAMEVGSDVVVNYGMELGGGSLTVRDTSFDDLGLSFSF